MGVRNTCAARAKASVQALMARQLPAAGWSPLTIDGMQLWSFRSGIGSGLHTRLPITDPLKRSIPTFNSGTYLS